MNSRIKTFSDRLIEAIDEKKSFVVAGLDPRFERIPSFFKEDPVRNHGLNLKAVGVTITLFNKFIIDIAAPKIPAMKPQIAFYEMYGVHGLQAFDETVKYIKSKGMIAIEDAKRNDIGTTAAAYSVGHLGRVDITNQKSEAVFDLDAMTVNPYLGSDGIRPFLEDIRKCKKGIFVLVKTSNPSSGELQDLILEGGKMMVCEYVAQQVNEWGQAFIGHRGYSDVGAVVGATYPEQAKKLRKIMERAIFLVPGYGTQGGSAKDVVDCFREDGYGAIISSSRSINFPHGNNINVSDSLFEELVKNSIDNMNNEINSMLRIERGLAW